jgi:excisionase family DNA binding protein
MSSQGSNTSVVDSSQFMRTHEVARKLNISQKLVTRLMRDKKLPGFKVGRVWLVLKSDLENYLKRLLDTVNQVKGIGDDI